MAPGSQEVRTRDDSAPNAHRGRTEGVSSGQSQTAKSNQSAGLEPTQ